ncbi:MAG: polar amino acid transport system substrate-binding protein [Solirubrobacteraceae bacterium]|nr:polar amino acid transport system substrate-binding protein [Solirubrobacteraceae bacterium]
MYLARRLAIVPFLIALSAAMTACGGSSNSGSTAVSGTPVAATTSTSKSFASLLPPAIQSSKVIKLQTEVGYAPYEVYKADGKTIEGLDVDLWKALEPLLGVKFDVQDGTYANIIPALQSKRADVGWSAMALSSFVGNKQAKFLVYENRSFSGIVVNASNGSVKTGVDLCGKSLGFTNGEDPPIQNIQTQCKAAGKPAVQIKRFQKTPDIILAVESGQVDGRIVDSVNGNYFVKQSKGKLKFVADVLPRKEIPTGIAVPVDQPQLLSALQKALQELVDNGTYDKILNAWGAQGTGVKTISVAYKYAG